MIIERHPKSRELGKEKKISYVFCELLPAAPLLPQERLYTSQLYVSRRTKISNLKFISTPVNANCKNEPPHFSASAPFHFPPQSPHTIHEGQPPHQDPSIAGSPWRCKIASLLATSGESTWSNPKSILVWESPKEASAAWPMASAKSAEATSGEGIPPK